MFDLHHPHPVDALRNFLRNAHQRAEIVSNDVKWMNNVIRHFGRPVLSTFNSANRGSRVVTAYHNKDVEEFIKAVASLLGRSREDLILELVGAGLTEMLINVRTNKKM